MLLMNSNSLHRCLHGSQEDSYVHMTAIFIEWLTTALQCTWMASPKFTTLISGLLMFPTNIRERVGEVENINAANNGNQLISVYLEAVLS